LGTLRLWGHLGCGDNEPSGPPEFWGHRGFGDTHALVTPTWHPGWPSVRCPPPSAASGTPAALGAGSAPAAAHAARPPAHSFFLDRLIYDKDHDWANYPKGMIYLLMKAGYKIDHGFNIYFKGNLPDGAGLSSSASIELLMGNILNDVFNLGIDQLDLVKMGQKNENDYIGVNSGIMDEFAVGMGKKDQAILLDTNTMEYHYAPVELGDHAIVIMNTNKHRALADSKYNERRSQCEQALALLQKKLDIKSLGELSIDEFDRNSYLINDDILIRRARHAVFENQRTLKAIKYLKENNLVEFGKLVNASHVSLHYDYEVTGVELDTLVEAAWQQPGVLGARMVGAGFGGCAIAFVEKKQIDNFKQNVNLYSP